jgi:hypothetical protein
MPSHFFPERNSQMLLTLSGYPDATTVHLAGPFNDWSPSSILCSRVEGGWQAQLSFYESGKVLFKFVVNGSIWVTSDFHQVLEFEDVNFFPCRFSRIHLDVVRLIVDWSIYLEDPRINFPYCTPKRFKMLIKLSGVCRIFQFAAFSKSKVHRTH